jgi:hypothetical protein
MKSAIVFAALLAAAPAVVLAQPAPAPQAAAPQGNAPKTYDFSDDAAPWINDPAIHDFYQATIDAFAQGPAKVDRDAFEARSKEIFRKFALSHGMSPEAVQNHVKAIPGEVILIVTREPKTLDSYDNFVVALFGPQKSGPGSKP